MQPQCECKDKLRISCTAGLKAYRSDICLAARLETEISSWVLRKIEKLHLNIDPHMISMGSSPSVISVTSCSLSSVKKISMFSLMEGCFCR